MKVLEAVGATRTAPCGVVCAASLSLMYSSMHPLGRAVKRLERTLLNFFSWRCVRGGFFGVPEGCFKGNFGAAARQGWAVLPRNSAVFGLVSGAGRRFSARRTQRDSRGEKFFKKGVGKGEKSKNWGAGGARRWSGSTLYRVRGVIFESGG